MKRFRELVAHIRERYPSDNFFANFEQSCRAEPSRIKHYRSYNEALMLLDEESWSTLRDKAINHFRDERKGQRKQGFFNQLNEAFAYRYLLLQGFKNIRFIKETKEKTPDISFVDRGTESFCEVKTIGISDAEINRRETPAVHDSSVYFNLSIKIQRTLESDIREAWAQIYSLGKNGLVFILIRLDDIASDHYKRNRKQLAEFCRSRGFENLVIKIDHRGNRGIRIKPRRVVGGRRKSL
jgi:hypothetical protein